MAKLCFWVTCTTKSANLLHTPLHTNEEDCRRRPPLPGVERKLSASFQGQKRGPPSRREAMGARVRQDMKLRRVTRHGLSRTTFPAQAMRCHLLAPSLLAKAHSREKWKLNKFYVGRATSWLGTERHLSTQSTVDRLRLDTLSHLLAGRSKPMYEHSSVEVAFHCPCVAPCSHDSSPQPSSYVQI